MNIFLPEHNLGYHIVSLALDETVRDDLLQDEIDFLYVTDNSIVFYPDGVVLSKKLENITALQAGNNFDVFELLPNGFLGRIYDDCSVDNSFFVTPRCNSNCIMCPSPDSARKQMDCADSNKLIEIARHIPISTPHLTITGGEPFVLGAQLFDFLSFLRDKYTQTEFLLLTNGRILAVGSFTKSLYESLPQHSILGIPLHGSTPEKHDRITRAKGSFLQTVTGIKKLLSYGIRVELRLVVTKLNIDDFMEMAKLIVDELSHVAYVSIMAAEMTGNARKNLDEVWIPYREASASIASAVEYLIQSGITVKLFNFPLCTVPKSFFYLCEKSISPEKVKYADVCAACKLRDACGGVFSGTYLLEKDELRPIL